MNLALVSNGSISQYPYLTLREDNPDTGFPLDLSEVDLSGFGVVVVNPTARPDVLSSQVVEEGQPVYVDGSWRQTWVVRDKTPEETTAEKSAQSVAALPVSPSIPPGLRRIVNDAKTTLLLGLGTPVVGGGINTVPVTWDGNNWIYG